MSRINSDHLDRAAYVYVRQSSMAQVQHNHESQRRQYGLRERARLLGWQDVRSWMMTLAVRAVASRDPALTGVDGGRSGRGGGGVRDRSVSAGTQRS